MTEFQEAVDRVVKKIPVGEVRSYQEVAREAGSPKAYRAVARIMANNFDPSIPCHRVIKSDGSAGGYNRGGPAIKRQLLAKEGVVL